MLDKEELLFDELYEKTKDCGRTQFIKLLMEKDRENKELKKQLEEYKATNEVLSHELTKDKILKQDHLTTCCGIPIGDIPKLITQQKEFIKYLEDCITELEKESTNKLQNTIYLGIRDITKEILQKYKEIIGENDV